MKPTNKKKAECMLIAYFAPVAKAANLTHYKDNIFKDKLGFKYYLDRFGFHTTIQYGNIQLPAKEKELELLISKYENKITQDDVGNKSKHKIRKILSRRDITDKDKVKDIKKYLNVE